LRRRPELAQATWGDPYYLEKIPLGNSSDRAIRQLR
jgi:hypothetical protein